jgi:hypothetical protein
LAWSAIAFCTVLRATPNSFAICAYVAPSAFLAAIVALRLFRSDALIASGV